MKHEMVNGTEIKQKSHHVISFLELCAEKRRVCGDEGVRPSEHEEVGKVGRGHPEVRCCSVIKQLAFDQKVRTWERQLNGENEESITFKLFAMETRQKFEV